MTLEQWLRNGWLLRNDATLAEIQQLLQVLEFASRERPC